jgi:hypothetical protein
MTAKTPAYDRVGRSYARHRRPDRRIAARIVAALQAIERLAADLASGAWDRRYPHLRGLEEIDVGYRLVVSTSA